MRHRLGGCALVVLVALSNAICQDPSVGTHPLSEPGDPPGLAELLKRHPRIVERPLITGRQAMELHLVDRLGGEREGIEWLAVSSVEEGATAASALRTLSTAAR